MPPERTGRRADLRQGRLDLGWKRPVQSKGPSCGRFEGRRPVERAPGGAGVREVGREGVLLGRAIRPRGREATPRAAVETPRLVLLARQNILGLAGNLACRFALIHVKNEGGDEKGCN